MDGQCTVEELRQKLRDMEKLVERQHEELIKKVPYVQQDDSLVCFIVIRILLQLLQSFYGFSGFCPGLPG